MAKRVSSKARSGAGLRRRGAMRAGAGRLAKASGSKNPKGKASAGTLAAGQSSTKSAKPQRDRQAERREAILSAALAEFSERGFTAARLDDVAQRARIAKGTIYLYFRDKETLFQELIRTRLFPVVGSIEQLRDINAPIRVFADQLVDLFVREVFGTARRDVIKLMIAEGSRFPKLADFYYDEVIARVMRTMSALMRRAYERGELADDTLAKFPQLLAAPAMMAIIWNGLFDRRAPLDVGAMLKAHIDLILRPHETRPKGRPE